MDAVETPLSTGRRRNAGVYGRPLRSQEIDANLPEEPADREYSCKAEMGLGPHTISITLVCRRLCSQVPDAPYCLLQTRRPRTMNISKTSLSIAMQILLNPLLPAHLSLTTQNTVDMSRQARRPWEAARTTGIHPSSENSKFRQVWHEQGRRVRICKVCLLT
ncbi:hypothetical protein BC628DRAFT_420460 [Trametes gibbosa]|nr:hypothetical protein BC628DRAFT_420460 [Trametes gibbosa]